jgi:hypothetical protein
LKRRAHLACCCLAEFRPPRPDVREFDLALADLVAKSLRDRHADQKLFDLGRGSGPGFATPFFNTLSYHRAAGEALISAKFHRLKAFFEAW